MNIRYIRGDMQKDKRGNEKLNTEIKNDKN